MKDYLPWGTGPDGWASLFYQYQTALYSTRYVHSSFIQMFLDYGITILPAFLVFIIFTVKRLINAFTAYKNDKTNRIRITLSAVLAAGMMVHAVIDIDSEFMLFMIFFILFSSVIWIYGFKPVERILELNKTRRRVVVVLIILIISIQSVLLGSCLSFVRGNALLEAGNVDRAIKAYNLAAKLNPLWTEPYEKRQAKHHWKQHG